MFRFGPLNKHRSCCCYSVTEDGWEWEWGHKCHTPYEARLVAAGWTASRRSTDHLFKQPFVSSALCSWQQLAARTGHSSPARQSLQFVAGLWEAHVAVFSQKWGRDNFSTIQGCPQLMLLNALWAKTYKEVWFVRFLLGHAGTAALMSID